MTAGGIYLDHHATTPCDPQVLQAMWPWYAERYGNAASINHEFGRAARDAVETARSEIATSLSCQPSEVIFTSGATEANNLALKGMVRLGPRPGAGAAPHLVVTAAEHRSVLDPARRLARVGCELTVLPVDAFGRVDPQAVEKALTPRTVLVSVMLANNEVGTLSPIAEIGRLCRAHQVPLHCDAAQAVGKILVDVSTLPVDLMSFTAHKLYGPQGVGGLMVRRRDPPLPLQCQIDGGGHERRLRSGTLPVALIVGFARACQLAVSVLPVESRRHSALRDRLQQRIVEAVPDARVNGHPTERLPGNLNLSFAEVDGEALMMSLPGLAVSSGSACTSADPEPSHVLRAMGVSESLSRASLRFGIGRFTTADEVERAAEIVIAAVRQLRRTATVG
jgi:cysteine desulfurase